MNSTIARLLALHVPALPIQRLRRERGGDGPARRLWLQGFFD